MIYFSDFAAASATVTTDYTQLVSTGERRPYAYVASATGFNIGTNVEAWQYFIDTGVANNTFFSGSGGTNAAGREITFELARPVVINGVRLYQSAATSHGVWKMQGSTDGSSWTDLGSTFTLSSTNADFTNTSTYYRFYKLVGVSGSISTSPYIYAVEFQASAFQAVAVSTDYANTGGEGSRGGVITTSQTTGLFAVGATAQLIDGANTNNVYFASATNVGKFFKFDFGSAKTIHEMRWTQQNTTVHRTWAIEGSNDDSSWTRLRSIWLYGPDITYPFNDDTAYRYYRVIGVEGNASSGPYLYEARFKISA